MKEATPRFDPQLLQGKPAWRAKLYLVLDLHIFTPWPRPNRWWRFWHWLLLGWQWENLEE